MSVCGTGLAPTVPAHLHSRDDVSQQLMCLNRVYKTSRKGVGTDSPTSPSFFEINMTDSFLHL